MHEFLILGVRRMLLQAVLAPCCGSTYCREAQSFLHVPSNKGRSNNLIAAMFGSFYSGSDCAIDRLAHSIESSCPGCGKEADLGYVLTVV